MMKWLVRPSDKYSKEEKAEIVKDFYKKAEQPKPKPMEMSKYISRIQQLYGNGDEYEDPRYIDPLEMQKIKEAIPVSPMVKKDKKEPVKIAKKPKPYFPSSAEEFMQIQDWLSIIDPNWMDEFKPKPEDDTRLRKKIIRTGITSLV